MKWIIRLAWPWIRKRLCSLQFRMMLIDELNKYLDLPGMTEDEERRMLQGIVENIQDRLFK